MSDQHAETVTAFDTATFKQTAKIETGGFPEGIIASGDGKTVLVACWDANTLEEIDVSKLAVTRTVEVGNGPRAFGNFLR